MLYNVPRKGIEDTPMVFGLQYNMPWQGIQDTLKVFGLLYNVPWQGIQDTLKVFWTAIYCALARDSGHTEGVWTAI